MTQKKNSPLIAVIACIAILAGVVILIVSLFNSTKKEPEAIISNGSLEITGQYGKTYVLSDITEVSLYDTMPTTVSKKNGAGLGEIKKGDYEVEDLGLCRLFVMSAQGPFLVINTKEGHVIIGFSDADKTRVLYEELK